jgi:signal transduction histidine kinase
VTDTRTVANRAILTVTNTGPLVPPAELPGLFRPFEQLNGAGGLGLGLAVVETITRTARSLSPEAAHPAASGSS